MVRIAYFGTDGCPGHHVIPIRGKFTEEDIVVVVPGTWHGKFKKEWPTEEEKKHIGKNGILNY